MPSGGGAVFEALASSGVDLAGLGLAWARALPAVTIVPAFGLRALPPSGRAMLGLTLAASFYPAVVPPAAPLHVPWAFAALGEVARGLPVAVAAAVPLWAATMAGGVVDALRGGAEVSSSPAVEGRTTPFGVVFSLLASTMFLASGGAARVATALAEGTVSANPALQAARDLSSGITLAVSLAGPILAASVILEVGVALVARAAAPAQVHTLLAPARALALLAIVAMVFDRLARLLGHTVI